MKKIIIQLSIICSLIIMCTSIMKLQSFALFDVLANYESSIQKRQKEECQKLSHYEKVKYNFEKILNKYKNLLSFV